MNFSNPCNVSCGIHDKNSYIAVLILSMSGGFIGFTAHIFVVLYTIRSKYHVSHIITSSSFAGAALCVYDGLWTALSFALQQPLATREGGFTVFIFFGASVNCDILLAVNRYVATHRLQQYKILFTPRRIKICIVSVWVLACITCIPYGIPGCRLFVDYQMLQVAFEDTPCGTALRISAQAFGAVSIFAIVLNMLTFLKLRESRRTIEEAVRNEVAERRAYRELSFFIQSCVTSLTSCLIIICINFIPWALHDRWSLYFVTSLMPIVFISTEGIFILHLNAETRKPFNSMVQQFKCMKNSSNEAGKIFNRKSKAIQARTAKLAVSETHKIATNIEINVDVPGSVQDIKR